MVHRSQTGLCLLISKIQLSLHFFSSRHELDKIMSDFNRLSLCYAFGNLGLETLHEVSSQSGGINGRAKLNASINCIELSNICFN